MTEEKKNAILKRMQRYCALEDRSVQKVREKLAPLDDLSEEETEEIIESLLEDRFLDEARFVESFVRSKVNQNRWGIRKIRNGLYRHRIPEVLIEEGLSGIDRKKYRENLDHLLAMKRAVSDDPASWIRYLTQKGYEYEDIIERIER